VRRLAPARLRLENLACPARLLAFAGPASHTGEDVVEYHLPGNPLLVHRVIGELLRLGGRSAEPGEFSARAFFNGKTRLDEAASNDAQLAAALQLRQGGLARRLWALTDNLAELLSLAELAIDFVEEDVIVLDTATTIDRIDALRREIDAIRQESTRLDQVGRPVRIAVVGRTNAGKSSLINRLVGYGRAVVSADEGTTRDVLEAHLELPRGTITLLDTAGLLDQPDDPIDRQATHQTRQALEAADHVIFARAADDSATDDSPPRASLRVVTKADLRPMPAGANGGVIFTSSVTGQGIDQLRDAITKQAFSGGDEKMPLQARHAGLLDEAAHALAAAAETLESGTMELLAADLRAALDALGTISGVVTPDDVLGRIFAGFCIGK
jgi:tRNA modification GTPase